MPQLTWTVLNGATDITSKVLSMNITQGREKYFDNYSGGSCTFTIDNTNNYAENIVYGNVVSVSTNGSSEFDCYFWVQEVDFQDHPGNTGLNLATITAVDWISRSGRVFANALVLPQTYCTTQFSEFRASNGGPLPADMNYLAAGSTQVSIASASTYTGSVNNYLNLIAMTERGYFALRQDFLFFIPRSLVRDFPPITTTLGPTASTTQIAYDTFDRIQNGLQFVNTATISPEGLTEQTAINTTSLTSYGPASYSASTVDYTTTQALGNAQWIATNFSEPATLRFRCSVSDRGQDATALSAWMLECWGDYYGSPNPVNSIFYQVPGGNLTSVQVFMEGFTINITPEQTRFELNLSPLQYYQFFILDDLVFGMLGGSGIVYNQAEISYDESGWTYNDSSADDTASRLGW